MSDLCQIIGSLWQYGDYYLHYFFNFLRHQMLSIGTIGLWISSQTDKYHLLSHWNILIQVIQHQNVN